VTASSRFLDDYARELRKIGERAFRHRYRSSVLVVSGRAAPQRRGRLQSEVKTVVGKREPVAGLVGRVFALVKRPEGTPGPVVIGRSDEGEIDVAIPDASISKRHCAFGARNGLATITDCGSTNGTLVNGTPVQGSWVMDLCGGELITLGRLELVFETPAGFAELVSGHRVSPS
jgi:pSer/pThr/pTyr-binding forkhead associated (FHA) protein